MNSPSIPKRHGLPGERTGTARMREGGLAAAGATSENLSEEVAAGSTPVAGTDAQASNGYPFYLYVYDTDGKHGDPVDIPTALGLRLLFQAAVKPAVDEWREVVITDCEYCCVFHAKNGRVIFPGRAT